MSIVDGDDSMWLQDAAVNRAVINIMLMFKGQPDIAHIRQIFADRLVAAVDGNSNGKVRRRRSKRAKVVITWICLFRKCSAQSTLSGCYCRPDYVCCMV